MKVVAIWLAGIVVILGISWAIEGNDFVLYKYFAPKREAVRREVFENTKSYVQGMNQELQAMQFDYLKATPDQQKALRAVILHRAADFTEAKGMTPDLAQFIQKLKDEQEHER